MIRVDLHSHTRYSRDCAMPVETLIERCVQYGIGCLAVTDHDTIRGALAARRIAPFPIIVGSEIRTLQGEIIGLFLKEDVPPSLSPAETIARIHQQGGLALVPHPYDRFRQARLDAAVLDLLADEVDIVEVFNARTPLPRDSERAEQFARQHGRALGLGTDAHTPVEAGRCYVEMEEFDMRSPEDFLRKLRAGRLERRRANPLVHLPTGVVTTVRALRCVA